MAGGFAALSAGDCPSESRCLAVQARRQSCGMCGRRPASGWSGCRRRRPPSRRSRQAWRRAAPRSGASPSPLSGRRPRSWPPRTRCFPSSSVPAASDVRAILREGTRPAAAASEAHDVGLKLTLQQQDVHRWLEACTLLVSVCHVQAILSNLHWHCCVCRCGWRC